MKDFTLEKIGGKIPANSQLDFNIYGDKVFALNVPAGCQIAFDNKAFVILKTGLRYGVNGWFSQTLREILMKINANLANALTPNTYNKISIRNENGEPVDVELLAGFGDINDDSVIITNRVNTSENWGLRDWNTYTTKNGWSQFNYTGGAGLALVENSGNIPLYLCNSQTAQAGGKKGVSIQPMEKFSFPFYNTFAISTGDASSEGNFRMVIFKQNG